MTAYCIFQEPWWLDAVAPGSWRSLEIVRNDQLVARMPIVTSRRFGFRIIRNPPLTPTLGPWLRAFDGSGLKRLASEKDLLTGLIDQLPHSDYFEASFHHQLTNWLPFYWRGFEQTTRYTYVLQDLSDLDRIWGRLHESVRRNIRKARRELAVRTDLSLDRLLDLSALTFRRQGQELPFTRDLAGRIDAACEFRNARRMFFAEDLKGRIHAALYVVLDKHCAYYLLGGADPQFRSSGAQNLLLWEAIQFASRQGIDFDFEGSMIEPIERVFRSFGARQVPYLQVFCSRPLTRLLLQTLPRELFQTLARGR
jgi:hypothetical protein